MFSRFRNTAMVALESSELIELPKRSGREKSTIGFLGPRERGAPRVADARVRPMPATGADIEPSATPPFLNQIFQQVISRLEKSMLYSKLTSALRRLEVQLVVPALCRARSTFADMLKKEVHSKADLRRLSYPVKGSVSDLLQADESTFDSATGKAATDIDSLLAEYDIQDNATLIGILNAKLALQELKGDAAGGLETVAKLRELQTKPDLKLTVGLFDESVLKAQQRGPSKEGADYQAKEESSYQEAVNPLPYETAQDIAKSARSMAGLDSEQLILGRAQHDLQPEIDHSGSLSRDSMYEVLQMRTELRTKPPLNTFQSTAS